MNPSVSFGLSVRCGLGLAAALLISCEDPSVVGLSPNAVRGASQLEDAAWSEPVHLGSIVNSIYADFDASLSRDGRSLYFTAGAQRGGAGLRDLWVARRASADDPWEAPQNLGTVVNTSAHESKPTISVDGHHLYFASNRGGNFDIYVSWRRDTDDDFGWEAPVSLGSVINTAASEESAVTFSEDEATGVRTMYFGSQRAGGRGGMDIYAATLHGDGTFEAPQIVPELSTAANDVDPSVRRDGLELFLASNRPGTFGANDLWVARRATVNDPWTAPANLGSTINTPPRDPALEQANDLRPWLSFDGTTLYFNSAFRAGNLSDMFDLWLTRRSRK